MKKEHFSECPNFEFIGLFSIVEFRPINTQLLYKFSHNTCRYFIGTVKWQNRITIRIRVVPLPMGTSADTCLMASILFYFSGDLNVFHTAYRDSEAGMAAWNQRLCESFRLLPLGVIVVNLGS